jgi:hypothetical protein
LLLEPGAEMQAMRLTAIDRLVHHATIFEMNVDSYRRKTAVEKTMRGALRLKVHLD